MTAMPQRIALSHALGALAATLVGVGEYSHDVALGFSGVDNGLFVDPKTFMLFGDARQSLLNLATEVKGA